MADSGNYLLHPGGGVRSADLTHADRSCETVDVGQQSAVDRCDEKEAIISAYSL